MPNYMLGFIDLETTGHDPVKRVKVPSLDYALIPWHEIIDIGGVIADSEKLEVLDEFEIKVRPLHPERCLPNLINHYPERSAKGEWDEAVSLPEAIALMLQKCKEYGEGLVVPGGQNFFFDWSFLTVAFAYCGIEEKEWRKCLHYSRFDTRSMAMQKLWAPGQPYSPGDFSLRNGSLQKQLGIEPEPEPHAALNGAWQAYEVFKSLRQKGGRK